MSSNYCSRLSVILVMAFLLAGIQVYARMIAPDWVKTGKSGEYPDERYLVGMGSARDTGDPSGDRNAADDAAKAKLIEQIRVTVESELDSYLAEYATRGKGRHTKEVSQKVTWRVRSSVNITLEGLSFPERYYDKKANTYYSLAVLDRNRASSTRFKKARELRRAAANYFKEAEARAGDADYGIAMVYYQQALSAVTEAIAREREGSAILARTIVVDPEGLSPWMIQIKIDNMREQAKLGVHVIERNPLDPGSHLVASAISLAFREKEFKLGSIGQAFKGMSYDSIVHLPPEERKRRVGDEVSFLVVGQVEARESSQMRLGSKTVYFYKSRAVVKLLNVHTGELITSTAFDYEEDTKSGKPDPAQAAADSLTKAGDIIAKDLVEAFENYLRGGHKSASPSH